MPPASGRLYPDFQIRPMLRFTGQAGYPCLQMYVPTPTCSLNAKAMSDNLLLYEKNQRVRTLTAILWIVLITSIHPGFAEYTVQDRQILPLDYLASPFLAFPFFG